MELIERTNGVLGESEAAGRHDREAALLSLRLTRDQAVTRMLRLSAQVSELALTQRGLLDAKRQLEAALDSVDRLQRG